MGRAHRPHTQAAPEPGGPSPRKSEGPSRPRRPGQLCRCQAGGFGHAAPQQPVFPCRRSHAEHLCRTHGGTVFGQKEALRGVPLGAKSRRRLPRASAGLGQPVARATLYIGRFRHGGGTTQNSYFCRRCPFLVSSRRLMFAGCSRGGAIVPRPHRRTRRTAPRAPKLLRKFGGDNH